jgi:hypothetical protein
MCVVDLNSSSWIFCPFFLLVMKETRRPRILNQFVFPCSSSLFPISCKILPEIWNFKPQISCTYYVRSSFAGYNQLLRMPDLLIKVIWRWNIKVSNQIIFIWDSTKRWRCGFECCSSTRLFCVVLLFLMGPDSVSNLKRLSFYSYRTNF